MAFCVVVAAAAAARRPLTSAPAAGDASQQAAGGVAGPALAAAAAASAAAVLATASARCDVDVEAGDPAFAEAEATGLDEAGRFERCLEYHQALKTSYKSRWDWDNEGSRIPTSSWPTSVPGPDEVGPLVADLRYCRRSPNFRSCGDYCDGLSFRIACHHLLHPDLDVQRRGLWIVRDLAERGHADGMCMYGMCLGEGRAGLDPNPHKAAVWFRLCTEMHSHPQAAYEMGVALFSGEGVAEDEAAAVRMFRRSANTGHPSAAYMLGDCLLDGVGVARDRAEALEWLVTAAELGHRGARSRTMAVLEKGEKGETRDYGAFTDSSRQTLVDAVPTHSPSPTSTAPAEPVTAEADGRPPLQSRPSQSAQERDAQEGRFDNRQATFERRFTIGGGARNPVVLARRRTIIQESRDVVAATDAKE